jgi:hypothetical protein
VLTAPFVLFWMSKTFLVEFFRKFFAFSSNYLRYFENKFLLGLSLLVLVIF